eukprot:gnl/MRDRNA2_/MRDRNA2_107658_c0_seq1.p1 gnl/MRDRNA2_/MRDRNA2_107658_c0~~gnl/MRDRNA2_/MRDRNA2_107658_c0_seq1.p1  ORF type:complete len:208 (-),score=28.55 gnl/MRDRNA2_/MRDRNA2_107658_c0_seq1:106-729(-)
MWRNVSAPELSENHPRWNSRPSTLSRVGSGIMDFPAAMPPDRRSNFMSTTGNFGRCRRPCVNEDSRYACGMATIVQCKAERAQQKMAKTRAKLGTGNTLKSFYTVSYSTAYAELEKQMRMKFIHNIFLKADEDGSGDICLTELQQCIHQPDVRKALAELGIQPHQTVRLFKAIDYDRNGSISVNEFMTGLHRQQKKVDEEARAMGGF